MKNARKLRLLWLEGKSCKKYLFCLFSLIVVLSAIVLYLQYILGEYTDEYYQPICNQHKEGVDITLRHMKYEDLNTLEQYDVVVNEVAFMANADLLRRFSFGNHSENDWQGRVLVGNEIVEVLEQVIVAGMSPSELVQTAEVTYIWISKEVAETYGFGCDEQIEVSSMTLEHEKVVIAGIFEGDGMQFDIFMEESAGNRLILQAGYHNRCGVKLTVPDIDNFLKIYKALEESNLRPSADGLLLQQLRSYRLIKQSIQFFTLLIIFAIAFLVSYCISVLMILRKQAIMIWNAFGLSESNITAIYLYICQIMVLVASLLSSALATVMTLYTDGLGVREDALTVLFVIMLKKSVVVTLALEVFLIGIMLMRWKTFRKKIQSFGIKRNM